MLFVSLDFGISHKTDSKYMERCINTNTNCFSTNYVSIFFSTKDKFIRVNHDDFFSNEQHILSNLPTKAEKMCRYDMDDLDDKWLLAYNGERARMGK